MKYQKPRGTIDLVGSDFYKYKFVTDKVLAILRRYGFTQVRTPIFESLGLLKKDAGEEVEGQIYKFIDKAGREFGLKSDITPALARIVGGQGKSMPKPIKFSCIDRVYRYERPQKGRLREITQINAEMFGASDAIADVEVMTCMLDCYQAIGIKNAQITIGYRPLLQKFVEKFSRDEGIQAKIIRLIDKKNKITEDKFNRELDDLNISEKEIKDLKKFLMLKGDSKEVLKQAEKYFCKEGIMKNYLKKLKEITNLLKQYERYQDCEINLGLARGSEYYTGVIFEAVLEGENSSVGGGGRYDNLVDSYSGYSIPAVGFSIGIDRICLLLEQKDFSPVIDYCIISDRKDQQKAIKKAQKLRKSGYSVQIDLLSKSTSEQLKSMKGQNVLNTIFIK